MGNDIAITHMSGYRIVWMLTMFDLPVTSKQQRKEATRFRQDLLDLGFEMAQFSVYMRSCVSRERCDALIRHIRNAIPSGGKVSILIFTDKQYENMVHFFEHKEYVPKDYGQLALF